MKLIKEKPILEIKTDELKFLKNFRDILDEPYLYDYVNNQSIMDILEDITYAEINGYENDYIKIIIKED